MIKRVLLAALLCLAPAAAQRKASSFRVCTSAYNGNGGLAAYTGGVNLYECAAVDTPDLTKPVGDLTFFCGNSNTNLGQNGNAACSYFFHVNGCLITTQGTWLIQPDGSTIPRNPQQWNTDGSAKGCPTAKAFKELGFTTQLAAGGGGYQETYTFTFKKPVARTPLNYRRH